MLTNLSGHMNHELVEHKIYELLEPIVLLPVA